MSVGTRTIISQPVGLHKGTSFGTSLLFYRRLTIKAYLRFGSNVATALFENGSTSIQIWCNVILDHLDNNTAISSTSLICNREIP